jgi:hypothetical protein
MYVKYVSVCLQGRLACCQNQFEVSSVGEGYSGHVQILRDT